MIKSMTGFGKANVNFLKSELNKNITVEIRSLNNKGFDLFLKLPSFYRAYEPHIRTFLSKKIERGKVDVFVTVESDEKAFKNEINSDLYNHYAAILKNITNGEVGQKEIMPVVMKLPDVLTSKDNEVDVEEEETLLKCIGLALDDFDVFRVKEGKALFADFVKRINLIQEKLNKIELYEKTRVNNIREKLLAQLELLQNSTLDNNRLEQEMIFYIEKLDITEEITRLKQHLKYFVDTLDELTNTGKKLSFITQEIGREINTIGSKANDFQLQKIVVEMKDELEKIKEQLFNVL